jgi:hypothetical protein
MTRADITVPSPETRVIFESPPLDHVDSDEDADRRAEVYAQGDRAEVAVVDGFGAQVVVERGHLELRDGVGQDRRLRRYSKIDPPRRVVVGIGTVGAVSFDALRWCSRWTAGPKVPNRHTLTQVKNEGFGFPCLTSTEGL